MPPSGWPPATPVSPLSRRPRHAKSVVGDGRGAGAAAGVGESTDTCSAAGPADRRQCQPGRLQMTDGWAEGRGRRRGGLPPRHGSRNHRQRSRQRTSPAHLSPSSPANFTIQRYCTLWRFKWDIFRYLHLLRTERHEKASIRTPEEQYSDSCAYGKVPLRRCEPLASSPDKQRSVIVSSRNMTDGSDSPPLHQSNSARQSRRHARRAGHRQPSVSRTDLRQQPAAQPRTAPRTAVDGRPPVVRAALAGSPVSRPARGRFKSANGRTAATGRAAAA